MDLGPRAVPSALKMTIDSLLIFELPSRLERAHVGRRNRHDTAWGGVGADLGIDVDATR